MQTLPLKLKNSISGFKTANIYLVNVKVKKGKGKGKAIPLKARKGPENSRRFRLPDSKTIGT